MFDNYRIRPTDELYHGEWKHHKYVSKHKSKSGKWVYVYNDGRTETVTEKNGEGLLDTEVTKTNLRTGDKETTVYRGKLSRTAESVRNRISNFLDEWTTTSATTTNLKTKKSRSEEFKGKLDKILDSTTDSVKSAVDSGKNFVDNLLKKK